MTVDKEGNPVEYLISPLLFVQDLLDKKDIVSSIDIILKDKNQSIKTKLDLQQKLGRL